MIEYKMETIILLSARMIRSSFKKWMNAVYKRITIYTHDSVNRAKSECESGKMYQKNYGNSTAA